MGHYAYNRRVFFAGQYWNIGRSVHSSEIYLGCTRSSAAILALVQFYITAPSSRSVILSSSVSVVPQRDQVVVVARWIAANSSLVGIMSCMAAYHADFSVLDSPAACRLAHTHCHGSAGYLRTTRISLRSLLIVTIISNTPQRRFLNAFIVSHGPGGVMYAV